MSQEGYAERTALVTGATGVLGSAISRRLVGDGIRTALLARNARHLELLEHLIGIPALTMRVRADVTEAFDLVETRNTIRDRFGSDPDLLVVAAGILRPAPFRAAVPAEWNAMIRTNVQGALHTVQTFMDGLLAAGAAGKPADLVLIGSAPVQERSQSYAVFSSLAAAIDQLARHLRAELGSQGVRVHHVAPQFIEAAAGADALETGSTSPAPLRVWNSESMGPERTADLVSFMTSLPPRANLAEVTIRTVGV
jgi:NADP-dependent 3-hydroxy acid dehydrogenase YdfG